MVANDFEVSGRRDTLAIERDPGHRDSADQPVGRTDFDAKRSIRIMELNVRTPFFSVTAKQSLFRFFTKRADGLVSVFAAIGSHRGGNTCNLEKTRNRKYPGLTTILSKKICSVQAEGGKEWYTEDRQRPVRSAVATVKIHRGRNHEVCIHIDCFVRSVGHRGNPKLGAIANPRRIPIGESTVSDRTKQGSRKGDERTHPTRNGPVKQRKKPPGKRLRSHRRGDRGQGLRSGHGHDQDSRHLETIGQERNLGRLQKQAGHFCRGNLPEKWPA